MFSGVVDSHLSFGRNNSNPLNVPSNVPPEVRAAQYISILIALIMEEEIPTALYFLRMIDRGAVQEKMKGNYSRFIMSNMCRLLIGMLFLLNVFLVLAQSRHGEFLFLYAVMHCEYYIHVMYTLLSLFVYILI